MPRASQQPRLWAQRQLTWPVRDKLSNHPSLLEWRALVRARGEEHLDLARCHHRRQARATDHHRADLAVAQIRDIADLDVARLDFLPSRHSPQDATETGSR